MIDLYHEMIETGVIQLDNDKSKTALVFGQMNEPPGARARVALTGLTIAEYFRDDEGQDVLLFIDNIFRFTQGKLTLSFSRIISRSSHRRLQLVPRCLRFSDVFLPLSDTNLLFRPTWEVCKNVSPPPRRDRSPVYRPSTSLPMI